MSIESTSDRAVNRALRNAEELSVVFTRTAEVLEESARLAVVHATRHERAGRAEVARSERQAAAWARAAAERARSHAARATGPHGRAPLDARLGSVPDGGVRGSPSR
jgi:hypothetical protein